MVTKSAKKVSKRLPFGSPKPPFLMPWREKLPLAKTPAGAMFSSHYEGPGPSLFTPKLASGTHCAPGLLFFTLLAPLLVPKLDPRAPQRSPKGAQGAQKEPQSHPRDTSKSLKNRRVTSNEKTSRKEGSGGAPGRENDTKIDQKTTNFSGDRILKKASISSCFLKPFGETIGGTVPKKAFIPSCFHLPIPTASHAGTLRDTQGHRFPRDTLSTIDRTHCPAQR